MPSGTDKADGPARHVADALVVGGGVMGIGATLRRQSDPGAELRRLSGTLWPAFAGALYAESGLDPEYRETGCIHLAADADELAALERVAGLFDNAQVLAG